MKKKVSVRKHRRRYQNRIIPVRRHSRTITTLERPRSPHKSLLKEARYDRQLWAQPVRAQPDLSILGLKDKREYVSAITAEEIEDWGADSVYLDRKVRGIRAIIVYDYMSDKVKIFSRLGKRLYDLEKMYESDILLELPRGRGDIVLDTEFYATKNNKGLHQNDLNGFAHNPTDPKYRTVESEFRIFDVLMMDGVDLRNKPLYNRKNILHYSFDDKGRLKETPTTKIKIYKNRRRNIENIHNELQDAIATGYEGLVVKESHSVYQHRKGGGLHWLKVKEFETLDLRLNKIHSYPNVRSGKAFRFYKHWEMMPSDSDLIIKSDKGIKAANLDDDYYKRFTKNALKKVDKKEWKASKETVPVNPKFRSYYGRSRVPAYIEIPKKDSKIVELFLEDMSKDFKASGVKIIGFRPDKKKADSIADMKRVYQTFYG